VKPCKQFMQIGSWENPTQAVLAEAKTLLACI